MQHFDYKAANRNGSVEQGNIAALNEQAALRLLRDKGLTPVRLQLAEGSGAPVAAAGKSWSKPLRHSRRKDKVGRAQVQSFTTELAVLLRAGLPIDRALKIQIEMSSGPATRGLLQSLLDTVKGGKPFSQGLEAYGEHFSPFYVNIVRSGEASGRLAEALSKLGEYLERSREVRSTVVSALIYPAILAVVALLSIAVMLGFVVPQFEALFEDMGDALPGLTRGVIALGNFITAWWWLLIIVLALAFDATRRWLASPEGRHWRDRILLRLPVAGEVLFKYQVGHFARTMGTLLGNGVSTLKALSIAVNTVDNTVVQASLQPLVSASKSGRRMSDTLLESGVFTPLVIQMIRLGEESGRLDEMLLELARIHDNEVQAGVKRGLTLLEPLLILFMGGGIALIIIAILMGILSVNDLAI
jgi:general secretion pathway protein F